MAWNDMTARVLSAATSAGAMGEHVLYQPDGAAYEIRGIWDDDHTAPAIDIDTPISDTGPVLSVRESDLVEPPVPGVDELTIRGRSYVVTDVKPDGQGTLDLLLNELEVPA